LSTSRRTLATALALAAIAIAGAPGAPGAHAQDAAARGGGEPVELTTGSGTLHGTLLRPEPGGGLRTAAVIIAGSGPTDRDGNSALLPGHNNSLRMLAEALADAGITTVRFDKRGIAASSAAMTAEADLRFQHYVDDAAGWVDQLRELRAFDRIFIIGHSEGALVATLAAQQTTVDGVILIAPMGRSMATTVRAQLATQLPPPMLAEVDSILAGIADGRTVDVPPMLAPLFRASVQPYLRSVMNIDPATELARVQAPTLIVSGTTDIQVTVEDARLLADAAQRSRLVVVERMNHILKQVEADMQQQMSSYSDPSLPLATELVRAIVDFLQPAPQDAGVSR
jgi:uncharacterized protein